MQSDKDLNNSNREAGEAQSVVASYEDYQRAQEAVDHLSDENFAVDRVTIVARDLRFVEQVTGRAGYGTAAMQGLSSGAAAGALFGLVFGLLGLIDPVVSALILGLYGLVFGAIVGAIIGLIAHALSGGRRDFSSVGGMRAGRYDVTAEEDVAEEAGRLLSEAGLLGMRQG